MNTTDCRCSNQVAQKKSIFHNYVFKMNNHLYFNSKYSPKKIDVAKLEKYKENMQSDRKLQKGRFSKFSLTHQLVCVLFLFFLLLFSLQQVFLRKNNHPTMHCILSVVMVGRCNIIKGEFLFCNWWFNWSKQYLGLAFRAPDITPVF